MGLFPYECPGCGGAYTRCGTPLQHVEMTWDPVNKKYSVDACEGGQMCWEDKVVFEYYGKYVVGTYTGYGYVDYNSIKVCPKEFAEFVYNPDYVTENFTCYSCFYCINKFSCNN